MRLVVLALSCAVAAGACDDDAIPMSRQQAQGEVFLGPPPLTVARVVHDRARLDGQTVRVVGTVRDVISPRAFVLADHGLLWAPTVPVIGRSAASFGGELLANGAEVQVIGIVRAEVTPQLVREVGPDVAPDVMVAVGRGPLIVAREVRRIRR